jgi:hypothetical protein
MKNIVYGILTRVFEHWKTSIAGLAILAVALTLTILTGLNDAPFEVSDTMLLGIYGTGCTLLLATDRNGKGPGSNSGNHPPTCQS